MKAKIQGISFKDFFPFSTEPGNDCSGINQSKMKTIAFHSKGLDEEQTLRIMKSHHDFLASGGAGGSWKILQVGDIVIGFYDFEKQTDGKQAVFEKLNLTATTFHRLEFPFANFCGVYAEKVDFSFSNLGYSLFTDASLEGANFENSNLKNVDFSRSNLQSANFENANLSGVDFENCDLTGANFKNTKLDSARFPGAILKRVTK